MSDITPLAHACYLAEVQRQVARSMHVADPRRDARQVPWPIGQLRRLAFAALGPRPARSAAGLRS
jgi:hypothetical protein